jgi:hypothetical protein
MNVTHSHKTPFTQAGFSKGSKPKFSATTPLTAPKFSGATATGSEAAFNGLNDSLKAILPKLEELIKPFKPFLEKIKNNPLLLLIGGLLAVFGFNGVQAKASETAEAEASTGAQTASA